MLISIANGSEKQQQHSAHEHGVAEMNLAKLGKEIQIELIAPAFNLVGFEHKPNSSDQEAMVARVKKILENPSALFVFEDNVCVTEHVSIKSPFESDHDQHKEDTHKKEEHSHEHKHTSHGHSTTPEKDSHSEYALAYHFECEYSKSILNIDMVSFFSNFPHFSEIKLQWLSNNKQGSFELTPKRTRISIK